MKNTERSVVLLPDQKGKKFYVSKKRAVDVFDALIERLRSQGPPYHAAHVPQSDQYLPSNLRRGSKEHALFLFMLCLWMRGGVESDTAARFLKEMHEARPDVFIPDSYWDFGAEATGKQVANITKVLAEHRLGQRVEENALGWVYNMRKLARFWHGDPRRLMNDRPRFSKLAKRIIAKTSGEDKEFIRQDDPNGFMFFREKMVAMIAYFLMDSGLVPRFFSPVPVDFHVLRLLVANRIIRVKGKSLKKAVGVDFMTPATQRLAREVTEWYCRTRRVSPVALCDALWLLSRTYCRANPGNSGYVADDKRHQAMQEAKAAAAEDSSAIDGPDGHIQPLLGFVSFPEPAVPEVQETDGDEDADDGPTGRKRYLGLKWSESDLERPSMSARIAKCCGMCPLQGTCSYNISSGSYYTGGMLLPERLRFVPKDRQAHLFDHEAFAGTLHAPVDPGVRFAPIELKLAGE